jgi:hypothetical protein
MVINHLSVNTIRAYDVVLPHQNGNTPVFVAKSRLGLKMSNDPVALLTMVCSVYLPSDTMGK